MRRTGRGDEKKNELEGQQKSETDEGTEDASKDVRKKQVSQEEQGEMGGVEEYGGSTEEAEAAQDGEDAKVDRVLDGVSGQRTLQPAAGGGNRKRDQDSPNSSEASEGKPKDETGGTAHGDRMESPTEQVSEQEQGGKGKEREDDTLKEAEEGSVSKEDLGSEEKEGTKGDEAVNGIPQAELQSMVHMKVGLVVKKLETQIAVEQKAIRDTGRSSLVHVQSFQTTEEEAEGTEEGEAVCDGNKEEVSATGPTA